MWFCHHHWHQETGGSVGLATVPQQQPHSQISCQACTNYAIGPPQVGFYFRVEPPTILFLYVWCLFWCMLSAFRCHAGCCFHLWGLNHWGLHHCSPLELTHGRHMCNLVMVIGSHQVCTMWLLPPLLYGGATQISCPPAISTIWWSIQLWGLGSVIPSLHLPCMVGRGLLFQVSFLSDNMVDWICGGH